MDKWIFGSKEATLDFRRETKILLRRVEGASIALIKEGTNNPELLQTRYDLYPCIGGISWGYKGTGVHSLAYSLLPLFINVKGDLAESVSNMIDNLLSRLEIQTEYDLDSLEIFEAIEGKSRRDLPPTKDYTLEDILTNHRIPSD